MICVKKWVKKKKMSSKKTNIFYTPYFETKLIMDDILFTEVTNIETNKLNEYLTSLKSKLKPVELEETVLTEDTITLEEFSILETNAIENYKILVTELEDLFSFDLYKIYKLSIKNYNFYSEYCAVLSEKSVYKNLIGQVSRVILKNYKTPVVPNSKMFNMKYVMYMEDLLFFWKIKEMRPNIFRKFFKIKLNKWKLKRKKLRKLYTLKKFKRVVSFKKFKKMYYINNIRSRSIILRKDTSLKNILVKKIPISDRVVTQYSLEFFYKLNKFTPKLAVTSNLLEFCLENNDFLIYLRNYHQKPYWKLRKARIAHWSLFFNKTIRQQRYKGFIKKFLKQQDKLSYTYTFFVNFFTDFHISWTRTSKLESFCKRNFVQLSGSILKLPMFFCEFFKWKFFKKRNLFLKKKIGKWSFLNFKRSNCPWLQKKKNAPKVIKHVQPNCHYLNYISNLDVMTSSLHITNFADKYLFPVSDEFKVNSLVKLHMYRYKSNIKCM